MERENRIAFEHEHKRVEAFVRESIRSRRFSMITVNALLIIPIFLMALFAGSSKFQGESKTMPAIVTFVILTGIMVLIDVLMDLNGKTWKRLITTKNYRVADAVVVDKEHHSGKYAYYHIEVRFEDGEQETFSVSDVTYEDASLGTKVLIVYAEDDKAMICRSDLVLNEDRPVEEPVQQQKEYDRDDEEDGEWD